MVQLASRYFKRIVRLAPLREFSRWYQSVRANRRVEQYLASGRKPWTPGYLDYKQRELQEILTNQELLDRFLDHAFLPTNYGFRLDERVVEYPWVLSRLSVADANLLLDAGSALNHECVQDLPPLSSRSVVIYNLSREHVIQRTNVSYIYGDLRRTILRDECFDEIVCISTLEHVGMNNAFIYSDDLRLNEFSPDDYQRALAEFKRLLKPGGRLFVTVPYGRYENFGWLQQFNRPMIDTVIGVFGGASSEVVYYRYYPDGWQIADAESCTNCRYFDIHSEREYGEDYAAAARAVACIEIVK